MKPLFIEVDQAAMISVNIEFALEQIVTPLFNSH
jgi:hypothetical protein